MAASPGAWQATSGDPKVMQVSLKRLKDVHAERKETGVVRWGSALFVFKSPDG